MPHEAVGSRTGRGDVTDADTLVEDPPATEPAVDAASEPGGPRPLRLLAHRVTGSSRDRLLEAFPCEIVEERGRADNIDIIVVSTRMPLGQVSGALAGFRRIRTVPVVAIVHAGGEDLATELLRAGAAGLVAEGNEAAIASFAGHRRSDASLVETYEQHLGRSRPEDLGSPGRDPVTGLPTRGGFEAVLAEAAQTGEVPRVGFVRLLDFEDSVRRLSEEATNLLRRRLAAQFREIGRLYGADFYSVDNAQYAFVSSRLSAVETREMGRMLIRAAETFAPSGGRTLSIAIGHAGLEVTSEVSAVRELAQRAMELASTGSDSAVLSADDLSRTLAATTELQVLLRMVGVVERQTGDEGKGARVGELAGMLARHLGFEGLERSRIRLAGHLHEIGKISLPASVAKDDAPLEGEDLEAYRRYPELGANYLRVSAGEEVAEAVRYHREHWDGSGHPQGLEEEDIPVGARVVAVARALEVAISDGMGEGAAVAQVLEAAGTRFDPTVANAARGVFGTETGDSGP
jgi:HD-GYP domain-containing protein (c-di-GMP phosphodiesterase class II)